MQKQANEKKLGRDHDSYTTEMVWKNESTKKKKKNIRREKWSAAETKARWIEDNVKKVRTE